MATPKRTRPGSYTADLANDVLDRLADGQSLLSIAKRTDMPSRKTVVSWVTNDVEGFSTRYARARDLGLDHLAEEVLQIADTPKGGVIVKTDADGKKETTRRDMVERSRLQVDSRKWYLAKLAPKRYGEKTSLDLSSSDGTMSQSPMDEISRASRVAALIALAQSRMAAEKADAVDWPNPDNKDNSEG